MFLFLKKLFILIEANYFTILWWFLPYIDMNQPRVYMCPESYPPTFLPTHPSGLSQSTGLECLASCMELSLAIYFTYSKTHISGFPHSSVGKSSACNTENPGSISGSGRSPGEGNGNPLQYSCLENPTDRGD